MITQTDTATTRDWLGGSEKIKIAAYVQNYVNTAFTLEISAIAPIPDKSLLDTLVKTGMAFRLERHLPAAQSKLELEFQAWDSLSDEAFLNLEQELG